jgi:hypothetical protein
MSTRMQVPDALRVAAIFEADDIISVPAMACRVLAKYVQELEEKVSELNSEVEAWRDQTGD